MDSIAIYIYETSRYWSSDVIIYASNLLKPYKTHKHIKMVCQLSHLPRVINAYYFPLLVLGINGIKLKYLPTQVLQYRIQVEIFH